MIAWSWHHCPNNWSHLFFYLFELWCVPSVCLPVMSPSHWFVIPPNITPPSQQLTRQRMSWSLWHILLSNWSVLTLRGQCLIQQRPLRQMGSPHEQEDLIRIISHLVKEETFARPFVRGDRFVGPVTWGWHTPQISQRISQGLRPRWTPGRHFGSCVTLEHFCPSPKLRKHMQIVLSVCHNHIRKCLHHLHLFPCGVQGCAGFWPTLFCEKSAALSGQHCSRQFSANIWTTRQKTLQKLISYLEAIFPSFQLWR